MCSSDLRSARASALAEPGGSDRGKADPLLCTRKVQNPFLLPLWFELGGADDARGSARSALSSSLPAPLIRFVADWAGAFRALVVWRHPARLCFDWFSFASLPPPPAQNTAGLGRHLSLHSSVVLWSHYLLLHHPPSEPAIDELDLVREWG